MKKVSIALFHILLFSVLVFAQSEKSPCPAIDVSSGGVIQPGEPMTFSAYVGDEAKNLRLEYLWTVSGGTIIEGLGSATIKVITETKDGVNITATVEIKGLPETCPKIASETGSIPNCGGLPILADEFGKLPNGEVKARINAIYVQLANEQNSQGYFINYGTDKEIAAREKQIRKAIDLLKYDSSRVTLVRGGANPNGVGVWTKVWIVPPGVANPQP